MIFSALSHTRVWGISWYVLFQTFVVILHIDRVILHIHMIAVRGRPELIPNPGPENKGLAFAIHNSATPTPKRNPGCDIPFATIKYRFSEFHKLFAR